MAAFFFICEYLNITPWDFFDLDAQEPEELKQIIENLSAFIVTVEHHLQKGETLHMNWSDIAGAYRRRRCIYLYADNNRAFLLPNGQADADDSELWDRISEHVSEKKRK